MAEEDPKYKTHSLDDYPLFGIKVPGWSGAHEIVLPDYSNQFIHNKSFKDHTGRWIRENDKCAMDSGHAHCGDWKGLIVLSDNELAFRHDEPELGDVPVKECFHLLEVLRE